MAENRISASLAPADKEAVMQAIATIREKLPFLVDLTTEERRTMLKMGDKSRAFVSKALEVATQNPNSGLTQELSETLIPLLIQDLRKNSLKLLFLCEFRTYARTL